MRFICVFLFFLISVCTFSQNFKLSGTVTDESGFPVAFASIKDTLSQKGNYTNEDGEYIISLPAGRYVFLFKSVGYQKQTVSINLESDKTLNVTLKEDVLQLNEVVIESNEVQEKLNNVEMSTEEMTVEEIKKIPAFLGEADVIKSIQLLPGVTTVGEGATGFNVRGGNIDQNLILADNASIYSSSHLFGFFSVFNPDAIRGLKLYKGGMPSRYGERVSSVLDVDQRSGDFQEWHVDGGIGVVSSRLTLSGPIKKDKASILISGRRTYIDQFFRFAPDEGLQNTQAHFYDLNAKVDYLINDKNAISFTGYTGRDVFGLDGGRFKFNWGNTFGVLNYNHQFSDGFRLDVSLSNTDYQYLLGSNDFFDWTSQITTITQKVDFSYQLNDQHDLMFGIQNNNHRFKPGRVVPSETVGDIFPEIIVPQEHSMESGIYLQDKIKLSPKLSAMVGLRYSLYNSFGKADELIYGDNQAQLISNVVDTISFAKNEISSTYGGLEPRFSLLYKLDSMSSLKFAYNRNIQFMQLVSNTTSGLPLDIWKAADYHIKPLVSNQVAVGYVRGLLDRQIEASAEVYYKQLRDVMDFRNNADLFLNQNLETELLEGKGRAYGLELMLRKRKGKFTGWLSYTLSRVELLVDSDIRSEQINQGNWYFASWHKPHDLSFVSSYQISKRLSASLNFVYATGRAITFPDSRYAVLGVTVPNYSERNQGKLSDYHRLDLSAELQGKKNDQRKWQGSWVFSVYNVYSRNNAYSFTFTDPENDGSKVERLAILGAVFPSVTYNFKF